MVLYGSNKWNVLVNRGDTIYSEYTELRTEKGDQTFGFEDTEFFPAFTFLDFAESKKHSVTDLEKFLTFEASVWSHDKNRGFREEPWQLDSN